MKLIRVGDKIINLQKVSNLVDKIISLRSNGSTQADVASMLGIERSFISHLEGLGEVRKGKRIALVGFPIENKNEIEELALEFGVDFVYLLSEKERLSFAERQSRIDLFNELFEMIAKLKEYDVVIFLGSDMRISLVEKILDKEVLGISIGKSPIEEDQHVNPVQLRKIFEDLRIRDERKLRGVSGERGRKRKPWIFKKRSRGRSRASE